jgi:hypothetical protein
MDPGVLDTNVNDNFSRNVNGGAAGLLWKGLSRGEGSLRSNQYHLPQALWSKG